MNSASQNFPHHLGALRQRMLHPTDYELAVNYFLEEFAGDTAFVRGSEPEQMPHLVAVLNIVVSKAMGRHVEVENTLVSHLREQGFVHGNAQADGRIVLFFFLGQQAAQVELDSTITTVTDVQVDCAARFLRNEFLKVGRGADTQFLNVLRPVRIHRVRAGLFRCGNI